MVEFCSGPEHACRYHGNILDPEIHAENRPVLDGVGIVQLSFCSEMEVPRITLFAIVERRAGMSFVGSPENRTLSGRRPTRHRWLIEIR